MAHACSTTAAGDVVLTDGALTATVSPARGGQLVSLLSPAGAELIFSRAPGAAAGWAGGSPVLFPAVGRHRDGRVALAPGEPPRPMPLHGWAQSARFSLVNASADEAHGARALVRLAGWRALSADWPFEGALDIEYGLARGVLTVRHIVRRDVGDAGPVAMPFAIGSHITLRFPLLDGGDWGAGVLRTSLTHEHALAPGSLLSGACVAHAELGRAGCGLPLTHPLATDGVLGFGGRRAVAPSDPCELELEQPGVATVRLRQWYAGPGPRCAQCGAEAPEDGGAAACACGSSRRVSTSPHAHRHFVLWGEPPSAGAGGATGGFICPEPWLSGPDSLNTLQGTPLLLAGETATWTFEVALELADSARASSG